MDIKVMARAAGLSENDLKGKSLSEQIKLITKKMNDEKDNLELEVGKEYISNYQKKLSKLIDDSETPFEVYVKKIQQKKSLTLVKVIGSNKGGEKGDIVVYFNGKYSEVPEEDFVKSLDELQDLLIKKPKTKTTGAAKKPKK
jgi:hypothetical protein